MRPRRLARRLGGVGLALALVLVLGPPPASAHPPTGSWTAPTPDDGAELDALPTLQGTFEHPDPATNLGIDSVTVTLRDAENEKVEGGTREIDGGGQEQVTFSWPAAELPLLKNGTYSAVAKAVTATQTLPPHTAEESELPKRTFTLAVPPATPTGLRTSVPAGATQVGLVWNANHEPDLMGYLVERRAGDGPYAEVAWTWAAHAHAAGGTGLAGYVDQPPAGGQYGYRIVAVRCQGTYNEDGACAEALRSNKSAPATATVTAAATTTTAPGQGPTTTVAGGTGGARGVDLSRFGALQNQARRSTPRPTEPDTGFNPLLPFSGRPDDAGEGEEGGDEAALADELGDSQADERALLVPVALALILFVFALQLRVLMQHPALAPAGAVEALDPEGAGDDDDDEGGA